MNEEKQRRKWRPIIWVVIVIAVIATLLGIAFPYFVKARSCSAKQACINNLRMIEEGKKQWEMVFNLVSAVLNFPDIAVWNYSPDLAVQTANKFITTSPSNAIKALKEVTTIKIPLSEQYDANQKICHLCRLIFVAKTPANPLRAPMLGAPGLLPYMSMRPSDWPYMPFAIVDNVPLSLTSGYDIVGKPESAVSYVSYCISNGVLRAKPYPIPTVATASNALNKLFASETWRSLKWEDSGQGWSYTESEDYAKQSLRKQIENMQTNNPALP